MVKCDTKLATGGFARKYCRKFPNETIKTCYWPRRCQKISERDYQSLEESCIVDSYVFNEVFKLSNCSIVLLRIQNSQIGFYQTCGSSFTVRFSTGVIRCCTFLLTLATKSPLVHSLPVTISCASEKQR